jgi:CubicO group peptidase (beta-lactamase class C family)
MEKLIQDFLDERVASGAEVGVQVAVYRDGAQIVDAVAGDAGVGRPVAADTLFYGVSLGKALTSTIAVILVDRGVFGYDTRVADIWPEYAAHGKGATTIRHVLTQTAGVPGVPADTTPEALTDWDRMVSALADAEPWWEPGTRSGYHALSYGYLVGEIARRATGESLGSLLRSLVSGPLGVADELFFGVPAAALDRVARLVPGPVLEGWELPDDHPIFRMAPPVVQPSAELYNRDDILAADIPAGGTMTARATARLFAALIGEVDGVRLISEERLRDVSTVAVAQDDAIFGVPMHWTVGFGPGRPMRSEQDPPRVFGWSGMFGTHGEADPDSGLSFALLKNRFTDGDFSTVTQLAEIIDRAG